MNGELPRSDEVVSAADVQAALDRLAIQITARLAGRHPLMITVMSGGQIFAGQLLPRLTFSLDCSYVHVRRYGNDTSGGELVWITGPHEPVRGRVAQPAVDPRPAGDAGLSVSRRRRAARSSPFSRLPRAR